jgi:hypothetical protein
MNVDRFLPFLDKLKSKSNLIMVILGVIFLIDLFYGSPITRQIVLLQCRIMKIDPSTGSLKILSVFGTFSSVDSMAKVLDKALFIGFFILSGASYLYGIIGVIFNK